MSIITHIGTGNTLLDLILGGDKHVLGYMVGKMYNIVGPPGSGKTALATETIAHNYHTLEKGKFVFNYDDGERGFTFDPQKLYGMDIITPETKTSKTVEELYCNLENFMDSLESDQIGIYVIDSLDSLCSDKTEEHGEKRVKAFNNGSIFEDGTYSLDKQKFLSTEFFPHFASKIENSNCIVLFLSQLRTDPTVKFGPKDTVTGGKALLFYCHSRLWVTSCAKVLKKERQVGATMKVKTTKSKTRRPYRFGYISTIFDYGVDDIGSNIDFLFDLRTPKGALKTNIPKLKYSGSPDLKRDALIDSIDSNGLSDQLIFDTIARWEEIEDSIKSKRKGRYL